MTVSQSINKGPLAGVRVLDLSTMIFGPMAAQYLGDMGADVIKVEAPEGDLTRSIGPRRSPGMGAFYLNSNRNKRSVVLDIKRPEGRAMLDRLVGGSEVVLHSIRTASATRLGLDYASLAKVNSSIILCHLKGFSDDGAYAGRPAYDDVIQAASGMAALQAVVSGQPRYIPASIADKICSVHAAYAVMAAMLHKARTGEGQEVVVSMLETMVGFNTVEHLWGATFVPSIGPMGYVPQVTAARRPFKTLDGYLCVLPYTDTHWRAFCELVGDAGLTGDARFATHAQRHADQIGFWAEVGRRVATRTSAQWIEGLTAADVPFAPVNSLDDLLTDPHLASIGYWQTMEHSTEGPLRVSTPPVEMRASPPSVRRLPPGLGENTAEVLREYGVADEEIERLHALGVTRALDPPKAG